MRIVGWHNLVLVGPLLLGACGARQPMAPQPVLDVVEAPDPAQVKLDLAEALIEDGRANAALAMLAGLRGDGHRTPELDVLQAKALRELGLLNDAETMLVEVVDRHPRLAVAYGELGVLYLDKKDIDKAIAALQSAVRWDKDNPKYLNNLGFALMAAGQPEEAVDVLRHALRTTGSSAQTRGNLGFALVAAGKTDEALRVFVAQGSMAQAHYNIGVGLEAQGRFEAAQAAYRASLATHQDYEPAILALKRLDPTFQGPAMVPKEEKQ